VTATPGYGRWYADRRVLVQRWPLLDERIETRDFVADISLLRRDVGWRPTTLFTTG
jgi:hypothetical protein